MVVEANEAVVTAIYIYLQYYITAFNQFLKKITALLASKLVFMHCQFQHAVFKDIVLENMLIGLLVLVMINILKIGLTRLEDTIMWKYFQISQVTP